MTWPAAVFAVIFLVLRRRVWQACPTSHEGYSSHPYRLIGDSLPKYFFYFAYPLSMFLSGVTYARSRWLGNTVYDLMLTATGLFLYLAAAILTGSQTAALCGMGFFYVSFAAREILGPSIHLESYTFFFAALGLWVVCASLAGGSLAGVVAGSLLGSLGLWCKLTSKEFLWIPCVILLERGISLELACSLAVAGGMVWAFWKLCDAANRSAPAECYFFGSPAPADTVKSRIKRFLEYQDYELKLHYGNYERFRVMNIVRGALVQHHKNMSVYFPAVALFLAMWIMEAGTFETRLLLTLFLAVSATNCLSRLSFTFLSFEMGVFPLGAGAGLALQHLAPVLAAHPVPTALLGLITAAMVLHNYGAITYWTASLVRSLDYYEHAVLSLKGKVGPEDSIFCNCLDADIYFSLGCRFPPATFLFMRYVGSFFLTRMPERRDAFRRFFIERRPIYIVDTAKDLNITCIEEFSGLAYRLVREGSAHIYALEGDKAPPADGDFDPAGLYAYDHARHRRESELLRARAAEDALAGRELLARGQHEQALEALDRAVFANTGEKGLHLARARALAALSRPEEASRALRQELRSSPQDRQALAMLAELPRSWPWPARRGRFGRLLCRLGLAWHDYRRGAGAHRLEGGSC
ncbi:MAG: tetratricopeptide repeat protein [Acidobacteriota bacterium]